MPKQSKPTEQPATGEPMVAVAPDEGLHGDLAAVLPAESVIETVTISASPQVRTSARVQQPSIGRVVHFVLPSGAHRPADILEVNADGTVELLVKTLYKDQVGQHLEWSNAQFDESGATHTWHWPEYVPPKVAEPAAPTGDPSDATGA